MGRHNDGKCSGEPDTGQSRTMTADTTAIVRGVLALELAGGSVPARPALTADQAGELATRIGRDLAQLVPQASALDLSVGAAHFDPAEALRPGWSLHRRLSELHDRAPGRDQGPRVLAFGSDAKGEVPMPLQADLELAGGSLRVVPFVLQGAAALAEPVADALEDMLLAQGMAQPDTALLAQQAFGAQIEHARYLTVHDLAAMMSMQYDNQGLAPLWPLIEAALLAPQAEEWLDAAPEPLLRQAGGEVRMALFDPAGWCAHYGHERSQCERLEKTYEQYLMRQRQMAAVLEAHGLPVLFVHVEAGQDGREALQAG